MELLTIVAVCVGAAWLGLAVAWFVALSRARQQALDRVDIDGAMMTLSEAIWAVRRNGVDLDMDRLLAEDPLARAATLRAHLAESVEVTRIHEEAISLYEELAQIRTSALPLPKSAIAFDAAAITLGAAAMSNPDAFAAVLETTGSVAEAVFSMTKLSGLPMSDAVGDAIGETVAGLGGEQAAAIIGIGIPIGSLWSGGKRLSRGFDQGLHGRRIAENAGLDLAVHGGGAMAGGAIGTMFMPVIGTAVGSLLGGFVGSVAAARARQRHLRQAREEWIGCLADVGLAVDIHDFLHLRAPVDESQSLIERARDDLKATVDLAGRFIWPTSRYFVLKRLAEVADRDVARVGELRDSVDAILNQIAQVEPETRALHWLDMGAKNDLDLSNLLDAAADYRREYEIVTAVG